MSAAKQMAETQRKYDLLHHRMRVAHLESASPTWACGTPMLPSEIHVLKVQSKTVLDNLSIGYHSVDLSDAEYLADLDAFESTA